MNLDHAGAVALAQAVATGAHSCGDCTNHNSWFPGSSCRWCPSDNSCHAYGSVVDHCYFHGDITDSDKCPAPSTPPAPPPAPAPTATPFAADVIAALLPRLNITGVSPLTCVKDVARADVLFSEFAADEIGASRPRTAPAAAYGSRFYDVGCRV